MLSDGLMRRDFIKYLVAGTALTVSGLEKLNASVYQSIKSLDQKHIQDESPDGVYWDTIVRQFMF